MENRKENEEKGLRLLGCLLLGTAAVFATAGVVCGIMALAGVEPTPRRVAAAVLSLVLVKCWTTNGGGAR